MTYKVNLAPVWNLPVGQACYRNTKNEYCAIGLIMAGIFGAENVPTETEEASAEIEQLEQVLDSLGLGNDWATVNFDQPIIDGQNPEVVRANCVRKILQEGTAAGIFELVDTVSQQLVAA